MTRHSISKHGEGNASLRQKTRDCFLMIWPSSPLTRCLIAFAAGGVNSSFVRTGMFLVLLITSGVASAQGFDHWIRVVHEKSRSLDEVRVDMTISYGDKGGVASYTTETTMMKSGQQFCYQMENVEVVCDGGFRLDVNHDFQTINAIRLEEGQPDVFQMLMPLDSILGFYTDPVKLSEDEQHVRFRVKQQGQLVKELWVTINKQAQSIEEIAYDYGLEEDLKHVVMSFETTTLASTDAPHFKISRFVRVKEGQVVGLAEAYQGYSFDQQE